MPAGAPYGNKNAERWTFEESEALLNKALELSFDSDYDFLGEIARDLKSYIDVFDYVVEKFPELKDIKNQILRNCEANCFSNSKKGKIREATAIVNLKSNHKWTDRTQTEHSGEIKGQSINLVYNDKQINLSE